MDDIEFKDRLTPEQYRVLRRRGTEAPGGGVLLHNDDNGDYMCAACGNVVFRSDTKYETTTPGLMGWPSFSDAANSSAVKLEPDSAFGMERTEAVCANCGSHLGHYFDDPSSPNGQHYCINSVALEFKPGDK